MLEVTALLKALDSPAVDIPSKMFKWVTVGKSERTCTMLDKLEVMDSIGAGASKQFRKNCLELCEVIDDICHSEDLISKISRQLRKSTVESRKGNFENVKHCRKW
jgi:hypothetical protein